MEARAEYERKLKELGSEEEDDLEVFDEAEASPDKDAMEEEELSPPKDKGKSRMLESEGPGRREQPDSRRKRPRIDPFAGKLDLGLFRGPVKLIHSYLTGYGEDNSNHTAMLEKPKKQAKKPSVADSDSSAHTPDQSGRSTPLSAVDDKQQRKAAKKARRKEKKLLS